MSQDANRKLDKKRSLQLVGLLLWRAGLLLAGAAVGVSHLVQSTRAGAAYGFGLILLVLLANVVKYPAFRFGPRSAPPSARVSRSQQPTVAKPGTKPLPRIRSATTCPRMTRVERSHARLRLAMR